MERLLCSLHNILRRGQPFLSLRSIFNASRINCGVRKPNTFISQHRMFKVNRLVSHFSLPFLVGGHCRQHFCNALLDFNLVLVVEVFNDHLSNCNNHSQDFDPRHISQHRMFMVNRLVSLFSLPFLVGGHCMQHFCNALLDFNLVLVVEVFNDHLNNCNNHSQDFNYVHNYDFIYLRTILRFLGAKIQQVFLSIIINCHPTW